MENTDKDLHLEQAAITQTPDNNRERFMSTLEDEVKKAMREDYYVGLCMLTLDNQPTEGDSYNPLLEELCWVIGNDAGLSDLFVPYTYMNVAMILRKVMPEDVADGARRICDAVSNRRFEVNGTEVRTTVSIGVACYPQTASSAEGLAQKAESAMLSAIEQGGNRAVISK